MARVVYLDSSALIKLVTPEPESSALDAFLVPHTGQLATSAIGVVEVARASVRADAVERGKEVLESVGVLELTDEIVERAGAVPPPSLRSLDAIHVATAASLGDELECLVAYDERLLDGARAFGLPVASPA